MTKLKSAEEILLEQVSENGATIRSYISPDGWLYKLML